MHNLSSHIGCFSFCLLIFVAHYMYQTINKFFGLCFCIIVGEVWKERWTDAIYFSGCEMAIFGIHYVDVKFLRPYYVNILRVCGMIWRNTIVFCHELFYAWMKDELYIIHKKNIITSVMHWKMSFCRHKGWDIFLN